MSSIAHKCASVCAGVFSIAAAIAAEPPQAISCRTQDAEHAAFMQAPAGARRVEAHVLEVVTEKAPQRFYDKSPHDEGGMSGVHWRYCGYNSQAKAHLIEKTEWGLFTGNVLFHESGRLAPAGHTVLFAPNGRKFLAIEQESGLDGETWTVYSSDEHVLWHGYAGTTSRANGAEVVVSTYERPQWNSQGDLTARFVCRAFRTSGRLKLTKSRSGKWKWQGQSKCS